MLSFRKKLLIFIGFVFLASIALVFLLFGGKKEEVKTPEVKKIDKNRPFEDYNNMTLLKPGVHTEEDVRKILGNPKNTTKAGDKKYLLYDTPFEDFRNFAVIRNGKLEYALENVFGNYRGTIGDYRRGYGQESIVYYETEDVGEWHVFLKHGFAIKTLGVIREVFYFIPQDENLFFNNFSEELEIQKEAPQRQIEYISPEP